VSALLPDVRLVAVLRDPVERAYSHYRHEVDLGREPLTFEDALAAEDERMRGELDRMASDEQYFSHAWWNHTYVARGLYAEQLERWLAVFPRERLLVLLNEDLSDHPARTYSEVLSFLGAPPHALEAFPRIFDREYADMAPETLRLLEDRFAEPNRRLARLLGRDLPWGAPA
jgi:hypothetical protein